MPKFLLSLLFWLLCGSTVFVKAQSTAEEKYIDNRLEEIRFNEKISDADREKALFKLKAESEKIGYKWGVLKSGRRIIEIYEKQHKNKEIIALATELKKIDAGSQASRTMANLYRSNATALGYLGLDEAGLKDFKTAVIFAKKIKDPDIKNYTLSLCYSNMNIYFINKKLENKTFRDSIINYCNKSIEAATLIKNGHQEISTEKKYSMIAFNYMRLGINYLAGQNKPWNIQKAEENLMKSLYIINKYNLIEEDKVMLLNQLSWLYLEKKDYKKTIEYANLSRNLGKQFPNPTNTVESFEFLASAYTELGDTKNAKLYMDKYTYLKDSIRISEKINADQSFNVLLTDSEKVQEKKFSLKIIIISIISFLLLLSIIIYWKRKNKLTHKKYEKLISKINNEKRISDNESQISAITSKKSGTPTENLIEKLEEFEKYENYSWEDLSLQWFANHLGTTPSELSEAIKTYKNKTFGNYIETLKINFIIRKLAANPIYREYSLSLLAEKSGYNTSKNFINSFKNETGITPSYFIDQLKKDNF